MSDTQTNYSSNYFSDIDQVFIEDGIRVLDDSIVVLTNAFTKHPKLENGTTFLITIADDWDNASSLTDGTDPDSQGFSFAKTTGTIYEYGTKIQPTVLTLNGVKGNPMVTYILGAHKSARETMESNLITTLEASTNTQYATSGAANTSAAAVSGDKDVLTAKEVMKSVRYHENQKTMPYMNQMYAMCYMGGHKYDLNNDDQFLKNLRAADKEALIKGSTGAALGVQILRPQPALNVDGSYPQVYGAYVFGADAIEYAFGEINNPLYKDYLYKTDEYVVVAEAPLESLARLMEIGYYFRHGSAIVQANRVREIIAYTSI